MSQNSELASRYATSLFDLAQKNSVDISTDFDRFMKILEIEPKLMNLLDGKDVSHAEKLNLLQELGKESQLSDLFFKILSFLIAEKRIGMIGVIRDEYQALVRKNKGSVLVRISGEGSAISNEAIEKITQFIREKFTHFKEIETSYTVDKNISKGFKVRFAGYQIDGSLDRKLEDFKQLF